MCVMIPKIDTIPKLTSMSKISAVGDVLNVAEDEAWYERNVGAWRRNAHISGCEHPSGDYVDLTELKKNNDENIYIFMMCDECGCISSPEPADPVVHQAPRYVRNISLDQISDLIRRSHWKPEMNYKFVEVSDEDMMEAVGMTYAEYRSAWLNNELR